VCEASRRAVAAEIDLVLHTWAMPDVGMAVEGGFGLAFMNGVEHNHLELKSTLEHAELRSTLGRASQDRLCSVL